MTFNFEIKPSCQDSIKKYCKKNSELQKAINNKINEIIENPEHYKPLKYDLAGERRVHIMKSFVLKFEIDYNLNTVVFIAFEHHDNAYLFLLGVI